MKKVDYNKILLLYIKMDEIAYYQINRETLLNRAKGYYKNNKEVLRKKAKNKYGELSEGEKNVEREYGRNRYKHMSEEKKRLKEYQNNYREVNKKL